MHFLTHLSIADTLVKKISSDLPIDKYHFIYGNIKPDLKSNGLTLAHTLENTMSKVCSLLDEIKNNNLDLFTFSVRLGELCHYLCDYFCYYHICETDYRRYSDHFIYEVELHIFWLWVKKAKEQETNFVRWDEDVPLTTMITRLRKQYKSKSHAFIKDIDYSLQACDWLIHTLTRDLQYVPALGYVPYSLYLLKEEEHESSTLHGYL